MTQSTEKYAVETTHHNQDGDEFPTYAAAVEYANALLDAIEEMEGATADRSWASRDNMYAGMCAGFSVQVVKDLSSEEEG